MKSRVRSLVSLGLGLLLAALPASGAKSDRVLTNAADILALTPAQAKQGLAISLTGVVTVAETTTNWRGKFFLQDETGGVFINNTNKTQPLVGDVLYVRGATHVGG
jgi:hypothetical protein